MVNTIYFLDTYALIEIIHGNENYIFLNEKVGFITTKLNLFELYYYCLRIYDENTAENYFEKFISYVLVYENEIIFKEAAKMKFKHKKAKLSLVDCIGYIIAKQNNILFVTGDKEFEKMPNVKFVK